MKILPSGLCTDAEFVRRVHLDLTGLPPTAEQVRKFLADARDSRVKRDELVDRLIGNTDFVEYWTNKWADLLQVNRKFLEVEGSVAFRNWIRAQVAANTAVRQVRPHDPDGQRLEPGEPGRGVLQDPPRAHRDDGEHDAALPGGPVQLQQVPRPPVRALDPGPVLPDGRVLRAGGPQARPGEQGPDDRRHRGRGGQAALRAGLRHQQGGGRPRPDQEGDGAQVPLPERVPPPAAGASRRVELAEWLTSKDNPYFARSYVNRLWGYMLGAGIIEPLDDIRAGNPPSNPELLDYLTEEFVKSGFDTRHVMRLICKSRTYQLSVETNKWNADDKTNYSHALARRLPAEVLLDAVYRVTGSVSKIPGVPAGHPRGGAAGFGRGAAQRLPDDLRPAGPRERLRVRALQRHAARAGHGAGQRPDPRPTPWPTRRAS